MVMDHHFKARIVTYYAKKHASAEITFHNIEFGSEIQYNGDRFYLPEISGTSRQLLSWGGRLFRIAPTRRLLIFRNANNLKTTRQTNGSGIPATENPMKSVRVLGCERRSVRYDRAVFANGLSF